MPTERSKPLFPTYGPAYLPGKSWEEYYVDFRKEDHPDPVDTDGDDDDLPEPITITTPAYVVENPTKGDGCPQALLTWRNRLLANDYEVKVGHCVSWHEDSYHKNGNLKAAAHEEQMWWVNAWNGKHYVTVSYNLRDGAVYSARTSRTIRGMWKLWGDKEFKQMVEGEDESA